MNRLIVVGSPRYDGRSAHLAEALFESCIDECPDDELSLASVASLNIEPCTACDACRFGLLDDKCDEEGKPRRCIIDDDMGELYGLIDDADEVIVVSPVYFAGPPAQLKALLDRLQPYFWTDARIQPKRPATLHVIGEGGDPHGFEPLVGTVRSALSCAGFALDQVFDWVGKIDEDGEITAEAAVHTSGASLNTEEADAVAQADPAETPVRDKPVLRISQDTKSPQGDRSKQGEQDGKPRKRKGGGHTDNQHTPRGTQQGKKRSGRQGARQDRQGRHQGGGGKSHG